MLTIGRLCIKIAGRDAGKTCAVVDIIDSHFVLIDGQTRRRKCNILHLEPLEPVLEISQGASHEEIAKAFNKAGLDVFSTKPKKAGAKPQRKRSAPKPKKAKALPEKKGKAEKSPESSAPPAEKPAEPAAPNDPAPKKTRAKKAEKT